MIAALVFGWFAAFLPPTSPIPRPTAPIHWECVSRDGQRLIPCDQVGALDHRTTHPREADRRKVDR